jgi:hypothetical protein
MIGLEINRYKIRKNLAINKKINKKKNKKKKQSKIGISQIRRSFMDKLRM